MRRFTGVAAAVALSMVGQPVLANQKFTIEDDGKIKFVASTTSITRISVKGDRIKSVINEDTRFEMMNDETTGDVFFRFSGEDAERESGFIVTESGRTFGYELRPANRSVDPVIVSFKSQGKEATSSQHDTLNGELDEVGFSDNIATQLTDVVRVVAGKHVIGKSAKGANGRVVARERGEGWKAKVVVVAAGKSGRLVREQDFYKSGISGIWVLKQSLAPNEKTFAVLVELTNGR
jgi:hypothetical protein